jgi:hypothetical protein
MVPIAQYPSIVTSSTPRFEGVFTGSQLKNFGMCVSELILSTVFYVSSIFYAHRDQSALNNFITDSAWSAGNLGMLDAGTFVRGSEDFRMTRKEKESNCLTILCRIMRLQSTWSLLETTSTTLTTRRSGLTTLAPLAPFERETLDSSVFRNLSERGTAQ